MWMRKGKNMISVNGEKIVLEGSKEVLRAETAYMLSILRSRLYSQGYGPGTVNNEISMITTAAQVFSPDRLRSDAKMIAESERLSKRQ